jgi:hypothetical protein
MNDSLDDAVSFQERGRPWMIACFGSAIAADVLERNHRFLEEALELVQATGCTSSEAHQLVDYVFSRPVGDADQEAGGVMLTLAALCNAKGLDMHEAGERERRRVWTKIEQIRAKQAAKPKHSPLPQETPAAPRKIALAGMIARAIEWFNGLMPEEQEKHLRKRESWARGEAALAEWERGQAPNIAGRSVFHICLPPGLDPTTKIMVCDFAEAVGDKLHRAEEKYGYRDGWRTDDWEEKCRADLVAHLNKGDPLDVAIYAAFLWARRWSTAPVWPRPPVMVRSADLPPPDTLIDYGNGCCGPMMLHHAGEGGSPAAIVQACGYRICTLRLEDQESALDLFGEYEAGAEDVLARWHPDPPEGWQLAGKHDGEDGPVAWFIRMVPTADCRLPDAAGAAAVIGAAATDDFTAAEAPVA